MRLHVGGRAGGLNNYCRWTTQGAGRTTVADLEVKEKGASAGNQWHEAPEVVHLSLVAIERSQEQANTPTSGQDAHPVLQ